MTTTPITSLDDVLDAALSKFCAECGGPLDPPGSQCAACGALPGETREEAAERLAAEADPVAAAEAARLREEAARLYVGALQVFRKADRVEYRSVLRRQRDAAQDRFKAAADAREGAVVVLAGAVAAEQEAAGPLEDAVANHARAVKAEEQARRLRKGAEAETEAVVRVQAAAAVLARYQAEAATAARAREAAEVAVLAAEQAVRDRETERDTAQMMLDRHASVPLGRVTLNSLFVPLLRMAFGTDIDGRVLSGVERAQVGVWGQWLHGAAFAEYAGIGQDGVEEEKLASSVRQLGNGFVEVRMAAPKDGGTLPPGAVSTPPPDLRPDTGMTLTPGIYQQPAPGAQ